jgi:arylsulfatase A-like enzyme
MYKKTFISGTLAIGIAIILSAQEKPNVIFIMSDDLNDWVGAFGGNPQTLTPNMDKLCSTNAMVFKNAHVPAPVCGPSRSAMLSGFRPSTTGCYSNTHNMRESSLIQEHATLPEYFSKNGYITISKGKIFHRHQTELGYDWGQWSFDIWEPTTGNYAIQKDKLYSRLQGYYNGEKRANALHEGGTPGNELTWAPTIAGKEGTTDYQTALWFADQLQKDYEKPFFMAVGFAKPHLPWYVPQEYFDRYDPASIVLPDYKLDDLDDILTPSGQKKFSATGDFEWIYQDEELHRLSVRAYMAAISYVDDCMGVVLDALEKSNYNENTIILIMGDHGWHLGEKLKYGKSTLWSEASKTPLIIKTPEMKKSSVCYRPVNLIDLYPTLLDICNLPIKNELEGRTISPLLKNPDKKWPYPSITTSNTSATANDENWRFIRYNDGTEELYNLKKDPMEWDNIILSKDKKSIAAKKYLEKWLPLEFAPALPDNKLSNRDPGISRQPDMTLKKTRDLNLLK